MQTRLPEQLLATDAGQEADRILRSCVHCGFCIATCPTFLLTGNELDSPRGRIYLLKEFLETGRATTITRRHLDRCLVCQGCETTCPSNVQYHRLLSLGQDKLAPATVPLGKRLYRGTVLALLGTPRVFALLVRLGRAMRFLLPGALARQLPGKPTFPERTAAATTGGRHVVLLQGCVQPSLSPDTNRAAARVLSELGISAVMLNNESCCGALHYHAGSQAKGVERARRLTDQLHDALDAGAEAIISTASGCGNFIKDYTAVFANDPAYRYRAGRVVAAVQDIGEYLARQDTGRLNLPGDNTLAFHSPCTLQHGQQLAGRTEALLESLGFRLPAVRNSHLCCGSAGTYSLFQPQMARALRKEKLAALDACGADAIATANIGCQCHLAGGTEKPVKHWVEFLAAALDGAG